MFSCIELSTGHWDTKIVDHDIIGFIDLDNVLVFVLLMDVKCIWFLRIIQCELIHLE